jgi:hypothetical protein
MSRLDAKFFAPTTGAGQVKRESGNYGSLFLRGGVWYCFTSRQKRVMTGSDQWGYCCAFSTCHFVSLELLLHHFHQLYHC